jgi:hypothetical protein
MKTATEFWEARQLAKDEDGKPIIRNGSHVWFRLGGKTLDGAQLLRARLSRVAGNPVAGDGGVKEVNREATDE